MEMNAFIVQIGWKQRMGNAWKYAKKNSSGVVTLEDAFHKSHMTTIVNILDMECLKRIQEIQGMTFGMRLAQRHAINSTFIKILIDSLGTDTSPEEFNAVLIMDKVTSVTISLAKIWTAITDLSLVIQMLAYIRLKYKDMLQVILKPFDIIGTKKISLLLLSLENGTQGSHQESSLGMAAWKELMDGSKCMVESLNLGSTINIMNHGNVLMTEVYAIAMAQSFLEPV